MMRRIGLLSVLICVPALAGGELAGCANWQAVFKDRYVNHPKRKEVLASPSPKGFSILYRSLASILGSKQMGGTLNTELEKSGYGDLFDVVMMLHNRGGMPDDFVAAVARFAKSGALDLDSEPYVIDTSNQEVLSKYRRLLCK